MTSDRLRLEMLDERRANERRRGVAGRQVMNERLDCKKEGKRERKDLRNRTQDGGLSHQIDSANEAVVLNKKRCSQRDVSCNALRFYSSRGPRLAGRKSAWESKLLSSRKGEAKAGEGERIRERIAVTREMKRSQVIPRVT